MAYSFADLSATEIADAAADKPLLLGESVIAAAKADGAFAAEWSAAGSFAGADITATGYPVARAYDRAWNTWTKPNAAATTHYLLFDLGATVAAFDHCIIGGHNFGTIGGLTVSLEIANASTFATDLIELASWSPGSSNKRLVDLSLGHGVDAAPNVYSSVRYLRIKTTGGSHTPQIGEIILGRRRQVTNRPRLPYDPISADSEVADFESRSGITTRYTLNRGRVVLSPQFSTSATADRTPFTSWWADCAQGTKPFVYIEEPQTTPGAARLMLTQPSFRMPAKTYNFRTIDLSMSEIGPFYDLET